jgi:dCMP deaminase
MNDYEAERRHIAYVPVISQAYLEFANLTKEPFHVLGDSLLDGIDTVRKDVRRIEPITAAKLLSVATSKEIDVIEVEVFEEIIQSGCEITMPRDEVSEALIAKFGVEPSKVKLNPVFLRWNRENLQSNVEISDVEEVDYRLIPNDVISIIQEHVDLSNDWWRQIGCILKPVDDELIHTSNSYVPTQYSAEIDGDIRSQAYQGVDIENLNAVHAEAKAIASAAKQGVALENSECFVSTFPCPSCAKLISSSGIESLYFFDGYAVGDGLNVLRANGLRITRISGIDLKPSAQSIAISKTYKPSEKF